MGIEKRVLIFPRSSVTIREYGTRLSGPDREFANSVRRPFSSALLRCETARTRSARHAFQPDRRSKQIGVEIMRCFNSLDRDLGTNEAICPATPDSTFADRLLKRTIPMWSWFKILSAGHGAKMKRTSPPPASLQRKAAPTLIARTAFAT